MSKKYRHIQNNTPGYEFINQYTSTLIARVITKYLNKLAKYTPEFHFIFVPHDNLKPPITEVVAVGNVSKLDETRWFEISEAFLEGLNYNI